MADLCPHCGQEMPVNADRLALGKERMKQFVIGDRVNHPGNGDGTVTSIDPLVFVQFDHVGTSGKHWTGGYDAQWFRDVNLLSRLESLKSPPPPEQGEQK